MQLAEEAANVPPLALANAAAAKAARFWGPRPGLRRIEAAP